MCTFIQLWDCINIDDTKIENGILYFSYKVFVDKNNLKTYNKFVEITIKD